MSGGGWGGVCMVVFLRANKLSVCRSIYRTMKCLVWTLNDVDKVILHQ